MPENITIIATSSRSLTFSWDQPGQYFRNSTILSYRIHCSSDYHAEFTLLQNITAPSQSFSMMGLNPFTRYNCCIATITANGNGLHHCISGITLEDGKLFLFFSTSIFHAPYTILPKQAPIFMQAPTLKFRSISQFAFLMSSCT